MNSRKYLGTGWKFPIRVNSRGGLSFSSEEEDIAEAVWIVLATDLNERQMLPEFGCGIHRYVFAPNNPTTQGEVAHQVRRALTTWEPRIDVLDVRAEPVADEGNKLLIRIDYRVRSTNAFHNLVYPFYIREGKRS